MTEKLSLEEWVHKWMDTEYWDPVEEQYDVEAMASDAQAEGITDEGWYTVVDQIERILNDA